MPNTRLIQKFRDLSLENVMFSYADILTAVFRSQEEAVRGFFAPYTFLNI
ncbi:hypothetical protein [Trichormus sp. NMC-1]|nr:hypothetical protein [Trichormus sp. NMC-1]